MNLQQPFVAGRVDCDKDVFGNYCDILTCLNLNLVLISVLKTWTGRTEPQDQYDQHKCFESVFHYIFSDFMNQQMSMLSVQDYKYPLGSTIVQSFNLLYIMIQSFYLSLLSKCIELRIFGNQNHMMKQCIRIALYVTQSSYILADNSFLDIQ